ncbi:phage tail length tape measure family protein [Devosia soli]|uniref:phage tail length tape measure family protein n=1 Tax=Devosia soli TaxID=361041 RepID=UPI001FCDE76D|nr:phage tail length tape measure family protein [Devosia soli]
MDSSQVEKGTVSLHQLTGAAGQASAAAQRLAGASQAEAAGQKAATAAAQAHNAALMAQNGIIRSSMQQRTMMIYQLNDVVVSLASGMNPAMVAIQQGSQIFQGGFAPALRTISDLTTGLIAKFWPLAAVIGVVAAAIGGLTYEFNKTADVQVSFFDVALAGWQMFAEMIGSILAPVWGGIVSALQWVWDQIAPIIKGMANTIIGSFSFAVQAIGALWSGLPAAIGDVTIQTANIVIKGIEWSIQRATELINSLITTANDGLGQFGLNIPTFGMPQISGFDNPFAGAAGQLGSNIGDAGANAFGTDYLGGLGDAWSKRAQDIARTRKETEALGGAASAANDNVKNLANDGLKAAAERAQEFANNLGKSIGGALKDLISGAKDFGQVMLDVLGNVAQYALQQASSIFGGMGGGFGFLGSILSGLFGGGFANGGVFSGGHVQPFANGGIVSRPTLFPMASGAGLMGEAGPEAIMPLRRGPDGRLGVSAANQDQQSVHVTVGVAADGNGNILPFVQSVSQSTVTQAAPSIVATARAGAAKDAPSAMSRYQVQQAGSDYRLG